MIPLCEDCVRRALPKKRQHMPLFLFQEIDSTNNAAKRSLADGCRPPALFLAEAQSAGRGRQGRSFYSPGETGLYMSLMLARPQRVETVVSITTMAAVAVCRAIRRLTDCKPGIKWVNDLYLHGKKICGILAEGVPGGIVVGIGVNVETAAFPAELMEKAASLDRPSLDRNRLAAEITAELLQMLDRPEDKSYMQDYRAWSLVLGRRVHYLRGGRLQEGLVLAVEDDGGLVLQSAEGTEVLRSGEISLRLTGSENW